MQEPDGELGGRRRVGHGGRKAIRRDIAIVVGRKLDEFVRAMFGGEDRGYSAPRHWTERTVGVMHGWGLDVEELGEGTVLIAPRGELDLAHAYAFDDAAAPRRAARAARAS